MISYFSRFFALSRCFFRYLRKMYYLDSRYSPTMTNETRISTPRSTNDTSEVKWTLTLPLEVSTRLATAPPNRPEWRKTVAESILFRGRQSEKSARIVRKS